MKKLLNLLLVGLLFSSLLLPANATLTNSSTRTSRSNSDNSSVDFYTALITATSLDTTATADSNTIPNLDGSIKDISAGIIASNKTGTSPTLTVSFIGSYTGATGSWFALKTMQTSAGTLGTLASTALDISTTDGTAANSAAIGISTSQFGLRLSLLPPYLRVRVVVGGSGSPGWNGVAYAVVKR